VCDSLPYHNVELGNTLNFNSHAFKIV
jgi:hypothetical protein